MSATLEIIEGDVTNLSVTNSPVLVEVETPGPKGDPGSPSIIYVENYGAVGNGVVNDTTAILNAIAALPDAGGVIEFSPGTYLVSNSGGSVALSLTSPNITLRGAGKNATVIKVSDTAHVLNITGTGCIVEDLTVDGSADGDYTGGTHGIRIQGISQEIRNVAVTNCKAYGIGVGQSDGSTTKGLRLDNLDISLTGNDAIDTKNRADANEDIIYSRITVKTWGQGAGSAQAGIDCRGPLKLSNITAYPTDDNVGIRFREGELEDVNGLGGHDSSLSQFHVIGSSASTSVGVYIAARRVVVDDGHISGVTYGVDVIEGHGKISKVIARNCGIYGFYLRTSTFTAQYTTLTNCEGSECTSGFRIQVPDITLNQCNAFDNTSYGVDISTASAIDTNLIDCILENNITGNVRDVGVTTHARNVKGWRTRNTFSADLAIDSTGTKTAVINHLLNVTPNINDVRLSLVRVTAVTDPAFVYWWVEAVTGTTVTIRLRVSTASATGGATVRVVGSVDSRP
jgi:hypothetical protein